MTTLHTLGDKIIKITDNRTKTTNGVVYGQISVYIFTPGGVDDGAYYPAQETFIFHNQVDELISILNTAKAREITT